uniref:Uncharacterized protein n=1 Tax=Ditylenchus dipsaci TaxID=166011 RepID=A0A915D275_9BILA
MDLHVDRRWLANVLARAEDNPNQPAIEGQLSLTNREKQCLIVNTCNRTAKTNFGSMEGLRLINEHVCRQSPNAFVRREAIAKVKTAAMTEFGSSSSTIVASAKSNLKKPVGGMSVDKSVREIVWLDYFKQTERGEAFLIYDSRETEPGLPVIFIFVSPALCEVAPWDRPKSKRIEYVKADRNILAVVEDFENRNVMD